MPYLKTNDGVKLYYEDSGAGRPILFIHEFSGGIPRTISVICDNVLVNGMALGRTMIDRATVTEVCRDLHLTPRSGAGPSSASRDSGRVSTAHTAPGSDLPASGPSGSQHGQSTPTSVRPERQRSSLLAAGGRVGRIIT